MLAVREAFASGTADGVRSECRRRWRLRSSRWSVMAWRACRRVGQGVQRARHEQRERAGDRAGASERNISVVVRPRRDPRCAPCTQFLSSPHTLSIGVIGPGTVGRVFLDGGRAGGAPPRPQARPARARHLTSKTMHLSEAGVPLGSWRKRWRITRRRPISRASSSMSRRLPAAFGDHRLQRESRRRRPLQGMARGGHPHRHAEQEGEQRRSRLLPRPAGGAARDRRSLSLRDDRRCRALVVQTLRDLRDTGDVVTSIEGIFSGRSPTSSMCTTAPCPSRRSLPCEAARCTEPDPRDDLSAPTWRAS